MSAEHITVLACDIDGTLLSPWDNPNAGDDALNELTFDLYNAKIANPGALLFGTVTGRVLANHQKLEWENGAFWLATDLMDFKITGVGSEVSIKVDADFFQDPDWPNAPNWNRHALEKLLSKQRPELNLQPEDAQGSHKLSFDVKGVANADHAAYTTELADQIASAGLSAEVIFSMGKYLDVLPEGVHKGSALNYAIGKLAVPSADCVYKIVAGDTMNDKDMLADADLALLPGNADATLQAWAQAEGNLRGELYIAERPYAAGVHEGLHAHGIL